MPGVSRRGSKLRVRRRVSSRSVQDFILSKEARKENYRHRDEGVLNNWRDGVMCREVRDKPLPRRNWDGKMECRGSSKFTLKNMKVLS